MRGDGEPSNAETESSFEFSLLCGAYARRIILEAGLEAYLGRDGAGAASRESAASAETRERERERERETRRE